MAWYAVLACYKLGIILEGTTLRAAAARPRRAPAMRCNAHTLSLFEWRRVDLDIGRVKVSRTGAVGTSMPLVPAPDRG